MSSEITPERIAELRRLCEAATPEPWKVDDGIDVDERGNAHKRDPETVLPVGIEVEHVSGVDASLIVAARNALPGLLDEIERLRHALEVSQEMVDRLVDEGEKKDAEVDRLHGVFEVVANALIQAELAEEEDLPCKADSFRDEAKTALVSFAPSGHLSDLASKLRAWLWREEAMREANEKIDKMRALLPKAFDAGWDLAFEPMASSRCEILDYRDSRCFAEIRSSIEQCAEIVEAGMKFSIDKKGIEQDAWVANALKEIEQ